MPWAFAMATRRGLRRALRLETLWLARGSHNEVGDATQGIVDESVARLRAHMRGLDNLPASDRRALTTASRIGP